jgi:hypothetical protein
MFTVSDRARHQTLAIADRRKQFRALQAVRGSGGSKVIIYRFRQMPLSFRT